LPGAASVSRADPAVSAFTRRSKKRKADMARLALFAAALAVALGFVATATGAPPTRVPFPSGDFVLSGACSFDVGITFPQQKEYALIFSDGTFIVTGQFKAELTNKQTGKTLAFNIPGPGHFTVSDDGTVTIVISGPWLIFWTAGQMGPGTPGGILYTTGRGVVSQTASGSFSFSHRTGTTTDVCAALSG